MSGIIIVKGISIHELLAREEKPLIEISDTFYSEIPRRFTRVESWPKMTNLLCWHCSRIPVSYPRFIPINPVNKITGDECDVLGNFDTWSCAFAYALREFPASARWDIQTNIVLFSKMFNGVIDDFEPPFTKIAVAPPQSEMKKYCGSRGLTQEAYGEKINNLMCNMNYKK